MSVAVPADDSLAKPAFRIDLLRPAFYALAAVLVVLVVLPLAWLAYYAIGLDYKVARLMADPAKLADMARRSRALGKPRAAATVLQRVLGEAS